MSELSMFAPLVNRDFCLWFYFLSILGFLFLFITIFSGIIIGISKKKDFSFYFNIFLISLSYGFLYFQNRLLYSMCSKTM